MGLFDFFKKKQPDTLDDSKSINKPIKNDLKCDDKFLTLESRLNKAFPTKEGLYPHEILMLEYAKSYQNNKNEFQNFWKWECSVVEPQKILDSLLDRGFICFDDVESALKHLTVVELKDLLAKVGEKVTGKKAELIDRVLNAYDSEELEKAVPTRHYTLTERGKKELEENEYVPYLHYHKYMSIWEMNIRLNENNPFHLKYRDIIWGYLNEQSGINYQNFNFGLYRCNRLDMYGFLIEEQKYNTALSLLVEVASFDLSGLGNGDSPVSKNELEIIRQTKYESRMINFFTNEDKSEVILLPAIIQDFKFLYEKLEMQSDEFIKCVYKQFESQHIYERVFSGKECANILLAEMGLEEKKLKNSYSIAEKRLKKLFGL